MLGLPRTTKFFLPLTMSAMILSGCGGSDHTNPGQVNSNPFAPAKRTTSMSQPRSTQDAAKSAEPADKKQSSATVVVSDKSPKQKPKMEAVVSPTASKLVREISKKTLDSANPGVAIVVNGISGNEVMALPILQQKLHSTALGSPASALLKQNQGSGKAPAVEDFMLDQKLVLVLRPVPQDLSDFAKQIKWGDVKEVDLRHRVITVDTKFQKLNELAVRTPMQQDDSVKVSANSESIKPIETTPSMKPALKQPAPSVEAADSNKTDRDLKPRPGEETIDWALRVIAGSSSFAHDTACKKLASMKPDPQQLERVSSVLSETLPLAKEGFRMKEHVKAMAVWHTDQATKAFAPLLEEEKLVLVRKELIGQISTIRTEAAAEVLVGRLSNRADLRDARRALLLMGSIAEKPVIQLLHHPDSSMRIEACRILQSIGTEATLATLDELIESEESDVARQVMAETKSDIKKKSNSPKK